MNGMTTASGGNISIRDTNNTILITPSGIDKGSLTSGDICRIGKDGNVSGKHTPSSEYPFHKAIYNIRPDINAVIHMHSPALVSFSIVHRIPDNGVFALPAIICGTAGYAKYELPGSEELGSKIAGELADKQTMAVIMENHGVVVCGTDIQDACNRLEILELTARILIHAQVIGKPVYLSNKQIGDYRKFMSRSLPEYIPDSAGREERLIRRNMCRILQRACSKDLIAGSCGTMSVRLEDDFLITPSDILRWDIHPEDIVYIQNGKTEKGKTPDNYVFLHQEIYKAHKNIHSIILAHPPNLMAFAVTSDEFNVRTIPESWIFLRDVPRIAYGSQFPGTGTIAGLVSKEIPAVLIANDSFLVTGDNLFQTYEKLEVAEFSAKSLILSKSLGNFKPINQKQTEALKEKFLK